MKYTYYITTESTCDANDEITKYEMLKIISMSYNFGENIYYQGCEGDLSVSDFYGRVKVGDLPTTAALSPYDITEAWEPILKDGYDILHIAFSSGLSATYSNLLLTANELNQKYPNRKVVVIDSLNASAGEGMCVFRMLKERENGKTLDEASAVAKELFAHQLAFFTVNDLTHLQRLGRVSKAAANIGTFLHLKPCLNVNNEGKLIPIEKVSGRKASISWLAKKVMENIDLTKGNDVFISDANCRDEALELAKKIKAQHPQMNISHSYIGPIIGSHCGEKTVAVFIYAKQPK